MKLFRREILIATATSLFVPSLFGLFTSEARAEGAPQNAALDKAIDDVGRARASLKTMSGPFTQERTIGLLAAKVRSTGTLTLVRPDRLRWELASPDDVIYWVTGEGLAYRSKRGEGHTGPGAGRLAAALDDLRTVLAGDLRQLLGRYDMRVVSTDPELAFEATPHPGTKLPVQRITFALAADKVSPTRVEIVEGPRDKTTITFGALKRDVPVDPASMRP
jgi:outer membrane lipoprotein-sorting protein